MPADPSAANDLCQFNREVIGQALVLVLQHLNGAEAAYEGPIGAHLRHVIEHYDALRAPGAGGTVDYDFRPRDRQLERCPQTALRRLLVLDQWLVGSGTASLDSALLIGGRTGLDGGRAFIVASTLGRELVFVGSHAIHHFALLKDHCQRQGIAIDPAFGKAPATVAHERIAGAAALQAGTPSPPRTARKDHVTL